MAELDCKRNTRKISDWEGVALAVKSWGDERPTYRQPHKGSIQQKAKRFLDGQNVESE
jgi:hypothetical protein